MSEFSTKERETVPAGQFGLPDKRKFPMPDAVHARDALARAAHLATPAEQAEIQANVRRLYPRIRVGGERAKD